MITSHFYRIFIFVCIFIFVSGNVCSEESMSLVGSHDMPISSLSFIDFNRYDIDSRGKHIWAVDANSSQIIKVDLFNYEKTLYVPVPGIFPEDICWQDADTLWVVDSQKRNISRLSVPGGKILRSYPSPGEGPAGLEFFEGYLWNTDFVSNKLYQLNTLDGKVVHEYSIPSLGAGMVAAKQGLYFIAENKIQKFDPKIGIITDVYSIPFPDAMGLAWDGLCFYVSQFNSDNVFVFELR